MSRAISFTRAGLRRAIKAAQEAGLRVAGIRPDGTLIIADKDPEDTEAIEREREIVL